MSEIFRVESSTQRIPVMNGEQVQAAESSPLHQLAEDAPYVPEVSGQFQIEFPVSNDETAGHYFKEIKARTGLPEYEAATNRVAFLVGESSFISVITDIPEDTILLVDRSPEMCAYMTRYIEALRTASSPQEWREMMNLDDDVDLEFMISEEYTDQQLYCFYLQLQRNYWQENGMEHALSSQSAFEAAQEAARQKAIVPWCADITNKQEMDVLNEALTKYNATITMMNLTNVFACDDGYWYDYAETAEYIVALRALPITPNAPILTTTRVREEDKTEDGKMFVAQQTGPFFGLDNLANEGGRTVEPNIGRIAERKYHPPIDKATAAAFRVMGGAGLHMATTQKGLLVVEGSKAK